jgi:hypothetical protein
MPRVTDLSPSDREDFTVPGRRAIQFRAAKTKIRKILDANPPLTPEQLAELAAMLQGKG